MTPSPDSPVEIAGKLTDVQRRAMLSNEPRLMGGYYGLAYFDPPLARPVGVNHPVFGSHYELNELGQAVRSILTDRKG